MNFCKIKPVLSVLTWPYRRLAWSWTVYGWTGSLLTGLLHDLTSAEIRLQLIHVFCFGQTETAGSASIPPPSPDVSLPAISALSLSLPGTLLSLNLASFVWPLHSDMGMCILHVPATDFTWKKWECWKVFVLQSSAFHQSLFSLQFNTGDVRACAHAFIYLFTISAHCSKDLVLYKLPWYQLHETAPVKAIKISELSFQMSLLLSFSHFPGMKRVFCDGLASHANNGTSPEQDKRLKLICQGQEPYCGVLFSPPPPFVSFLWSASPCWCWLSIITIRYFSQFFLQQNSDSF